MSEQQPPKQAPKKGRSPSYPAVALDAAIERAATLYAKEGRNRVPITVIHKDWGYAANSGPATVTLAALKKYGLLEDDGQGDKRLGWLSELAFTILRNPDAAAKQAAIQQAALTPTIHREIWTQYGGHPPSDDALHYELLTARNFTETGAREFISQFRRTVGYAQLVAVGSVVQDQPDATTDQGSGGEGVPPADLRTPPLADSITIPIPLVGATRVQISGQFPISEPAWQQLLAVLSAMKPGLVADPQAPTGA